MYEGFAQDSWKARQNLTINAGLRYTVIVPYHAVWGNQIVFDPALYDPSSGGNGRSQDGTHRRFADHRSALQRHGHSRKRIPSSAAAMSRKPIPDSTTGYSSGVPESLLGHSVERDSTAPGHSLSAQRQDSASRRRRPLLHASGGERFDLPRRESAVPAERQRDQSAQWMILDAVGRANIPLVVTTQSKNFKNPEAWNWNFTRRARNALEVARHGAYVGRRGLHLQRESDINQPTLAAVRQIPPPISTRFGLQGLRFHSRDG